MTFLVTNKKVTCYDGEKSISFEITLGMSVGFVYANVNSDVHINSDVHVKPYIVSPNFHIQFGTKLKYRLLGFELNDKNGNLVLGVNIHGTTTIDTESGAALLPISDALTLLHAIYDIHPMSIRHVMYGGAEIT